MADPVLSLNHYCTPVDQTMPWAKRTLKKCFLLDLLATIGFSIWQYRANPSLPLKAKLSLLCKKAPYVAAIAFVIIGIAHYKLRPARRFSFNDNPKFDQMSPEQTDVIREGLNSGKIYFSNREVQQEWNKKLAEEKASSGYVYA